MQGARKSCRLGDRASLPVASPGAQPGPPSRPRPFPSFFEARGPSGLLVFTAMSTAHTDMPAEEAL